MIPRSRWTARPTSGGWATPRCRPPSQGCHAAWSWPPGSGSPRGCQGTAKSKEAKPDRTLGKFWKHVVRLVVVHHSTYINFACFFLVLENSDKSLCRPCSGTVTQRAKNRVTKVQVWGVVCSLVQLRWVGNPKLTNFVLVTKKTKQTTKPECVQ